MSAWKPVNDALPLGWNDEGDRMTAPPSAAGWRVRRKLAPGSDAATATVRVAGVPLVLDLTATRENFVEAVAGSPGAYLLDFIDQTGHVLEARPALTLVGANSSSDPKLYQR